ncbi:WD domain, G-beta repeat, partial [Rhizoctonia solani]
MLCLSSPSPTPLTPAQPRLVQDSPPTPLPPNHQPGVTRATNDATVIRSKLDVNQETELPQLESALPEMGPKASVSELGSGNSNPPVSLHVTNNAKSGAKNILWSGMRVSLNALSKASGVLGPLGAAANILLDCFDTIETTSKNQQAYEDLAAELAALSQFLSEHPEEKKSSPMFGSVSGIVKQIENEAIEVKRKAEGGTGGLLTAQLDEQELTRHYRRIQSLFQQLQASVYDNDPDARATTQNTQLELLKPVELAGYDSSLSTSINRRTCTQGTRTKVLSDLTEWANDTDAPSVFWMNGMAGTGKTTIACTFSDQLKRKGLLAASFFCTRTTTECQDVNRIVPTIACQLAWYSASFQRRLCDAIDAEPNARSKTIDKQFELLLTGPLQKAEGETPRNQVVVIDALDECEDPKGVKVILSELFRHTPRLPIKFLVTSRPEPEIYDTMIKHVGPRMGVILHEIDSSLVAADIELYLREELTLILPDISDDDLRRLIERSGVLFIYAATLVRYIQPDNYHGDPYERLQTVLGLNQDAGQENLSIDVLYRMVLRSALNEKLQGSERKAIRAVLQTVLFAQEPIGVGTVGILADIDNPVSTRLVSALHASFPDFMFDQARSGEYFCDAIEHGPVLVHRCFQVMEKQLRMNICNLPSSFLPDEKVEDLGDRIKANISPTLAYACRYWANHLQVLTKVDDISATFGDFLSRRLLFWMEVMSLRRELSISVMALLMAKKWLISTATTSQPALAILIEDAANFMMGYASMPAPRSTPHIYISSLPLCPRSSTVYKNYQGRMQGILELKGSMMDRRETASVATWNIGLTLAVAYSSDGSRVVVGFVGDAVGIYNAYDGEVIVGPLIGHTDAVKSVSFSPDGRFIASGSKDKTIRLCDAFNGTLIGNPMEHAEAVNSISFSPDNLRIVSGCDDNKIWVWSVADGTLLLGLLEGHSEPVNSVTFSPEGTLIASGSSDRTVRLWRSKDGSSVTHPLQGGTQKLVCAMFTPDNTQLVSASTDGNICVWNVSNGLLVTSVNIKKISSAVVSPDGALIVVSTHDDLQVRRINDGSLVAGPFDSFPLPALAYSPDVDGTHVVLGSDEATQIWNLSDGTCKPNSDVEIQLASQSSRDSSLDAIYTAHTSENGLQKIVNTADGSVVAGPFDPSPHIWQFSCDSRSIIMGFKNGAIQVLPLTGGAATARLIAAHSHEVESIAQSLDGSALASLAKEPMGLKHSILDYFNKFYLNKHRPAPLSLHISSLLLPSLDLDSCLDSTRTSIQPHARSNINAHTGSEGRTGGWMVNSNGDLLFWLPSDIPSTLTPYTLLIVTKSGTLLVPKQELYVGDQWSRCYIEH